MQGSQAEGFIGSRLKAIPHSSLLFATQTQLLLQAKRQFIRLDLPTQTLVYSNAEEDRLVHAAYHAPLELYVLMTEKHLVAVNGEGELVRRLPCEQLIGAKYLFVIGLQDGYRGIPNHREDFLVFVRGDHLYSCPLGVSFERQMIKNKGICDFGVELGTLQLHESPEYIQSVCWLREEGLLILWNANETYVYSLPHLQGQGLRRLQIYNKISRRENLSLTYAVSLPLKIMAAGYQSGTVKLYHFDDSRKYLQELRGHQAACLSLLIPPGTPHFLYSAAADSSVRIWSLFDFQQVYCLQLDLLVAEVRFVTAQVLFVGTAQSPRRTYLCQLNTDLLEPVVNENRGGELQGLRCDGDWCIATYSNSHVEFIPAPSPSSSNTREQSANEKIEYPEKYGSVREVFRLQQDTYAIALQRGFSMVRFSKRQVTSQNFELKKLVYNESIAKTRQEDGFIELIHEKLLGTYLFNVLLDPKDIPVSIKVSYVYFHTSPVPLPRWDGSTCLRSGSGGETTYCVLGSAKGEIYFVDIEKRTHYHCKVYFHTTELTFIRAIAPPSHAPSHSNSCFLSISSDKQVVIWRLSSSEPPSALVILSFNREFTYRDLFHNYLVLGEKSGQLSILQIVTTPTLVVRKSSSTAGHIRAIICGDYMSYGGKGKGMGDDALFLSSGEDSVIKIWRGVQKELLFELKLFGIVSAVCFTRCRLDLIVCHNEQISILKDHRLKSLRRAVALLSLPPNQGNVEEIDPRQFFLRSNPSSPLPRHRLQRLTSRYVNLFHKMSVREDEGGREGEMTEGGREWKGETGREKGELRLQPAISLPQNTLQKPPSFQRFESLQRMPRLKRFHINSSLETESEVSLPRINTKVSAYEKVLPITVREDLKVRKSRKERSYSNAGRQNG